MQKIIMVFSVFLMMLVGVVGYPFLARSYSVEQFLFITILLFLNGFFGVFDLVRPVMVRHLANSEDRVDVSAYLVLSIKIAGFVSVFALLVFLFALPVHIDFVGAVYVSLSVFFFLVYSVPWAVFEIKGFVGTAYLIRALGFSSFVLGLMIFGFFEVKVAPALVFFISHVFVGVSFFYLGRFFLSLGRGQGRGVAFHDLLMTAPQNFSKVVIDFSDRILVSMQGGPVFAAAYNAIYDVSAKTNIFSQLFVAYSYPKLCRGEELKYFVSVGLVISVLGALLAIGMIPAGGYLMPLYLGQQYAEFSRFVPVMFLLASLYSLAFFSQSALRSQGMFEVLAAHFFVCALSGVGLMLILYVFYGFYGVVLSLFVLKAPGAVGYLYLRSKTNFGLVFDCLLIFYVFLFFVFFIFFEGVI